MDCSICGSVLYSLVRSAVLARHVSRARRILRRSLAARPCVGEEGSHGTEYTRLSATTLIDRNFITTTKKQALEEVGGCRWRRWAIERRCASCVNGEQTEADALLLQ